MNNIGSTRGTRCGIPSFKVIGFLVPEKKIFLRFLPYMGIRFTASAFRKLPSIYVFSYFPFGFEGRMWNLIVSVPDHCLSFYFTPFTTTRQEFIFIKMSHDI